MSDFMKKRYTLAEPGCGITVLSMEGSEINLFGSHTAIKTSAEDFFEPIQDFLHEKFVEEKADTMYYIGVAKTVVLGVLAGVAIVGGVIATVASSGAAAPLLGLGFALGGSAIASYDYTFNTLKRDRVIGYDRSWMQFYVEMNLREGMGAVTGGLVFAAIWLGGAAAIDTFKNLPNCIPAIVDVTAVGGAVGVAAEEEVVVGAVGVAALAAAALAVGKGGESKEGVEFKKEEDSGLDSFCDLDDLLENPDKLSGISGEELYDYLIKNGYDVKPLSKGSLKGVPFEEGGGFKVNWGGDRILQYHPVTSSHHGGAYFKISSGLTGTIRIDLNGTIIN